MWLITITFAAAIVTALWYFKDNGDYKLDVLALILWGAAIMIFIDHLTGYLEEGVFLEMTADATVLGIVLVLVAIVAWEAYVIFKDPKGKLNILFK